MADKKKSSKAAATKRSSSDRQIRVEVLPIDRAATPDPNNVNKHTARGGKLLENSLSRRGAFRSVASAGKGVETPVVGAGNLTYQKAVEAGFKEVINIHVRGDQLVNVVRDDVAPGSPEFFALAIEDNEIGKQSYNPDIDILSVLSVGENAILAGLRAADRDFNRVIEKMTKGGETYDDIPEQFAILIICKNEKQQSKLLKEFTEQGLECKALLS